MSSPSHPTYMPPAWSTCPAMPPASSPTIATTVPDLGQTIDPERRKRWKNVEDTREEYHTTNTVEVYIFGLPACGMVNVPGKTTFADLWNHVRRCLSLSPTITCNEGLGFIIIEDLKKMYQFEPGTFIHLGTESERNAFVPEFEIYDLVSRTRTVENNLLKDKYEHYGPELFSPSKNLCIAAPRVIEISLDIISRIIRTPDNLKLSPKESREFRVMFLYFEIAFREDEHRGEEIPVHFLHCTRISRDFHNYRISYADLGSQERKDFVDMASEQRIGCLLRHSVPRLFLSPPFNFPLIPTEDGDAVDEVALVADGVAKLDTAGAGPAEGQAA